MTDAEWVEAEAYFRQIANALGLQAWKFTLSREPTSSDASATCRVPYGSHRATINLAENWRKRSVTDQRDDTVHEVLHAHLAGADNVVTVDLKSHLNPAVYTALWDNYERWSEVAVDGLTAAIAPFLPLPRWEAKPDTLPTEPRADNPDDTVRA